MGSPRFQPAALFDTRSEFARDLPLELIAAWLQDRQTTESARQLLDPYRVHGTTVASDSAGLTRLSRDREPLEVMALINRPKEFVHQCGTAIGGKAMGLWTADNTEMFYPDTVACDQIASMLLTLQDRLGAESEVQIGMGAHFDSFFLIGNALYGDAAVGIECLAEDRTEGGEIVVTDAVWQKIDDPARFRMAPRNGDGLRLLDGPRLSWPANASPDYPIPFSKSFHQCLRDYFGHANLEDLRRMVQQSFTRECTVLLVERELPGAETTEATILGEMASAAIAHTHGALLLASTSGVEIKTAGTLSIYVFDTAADAWTFSVRFREDLLNNGISTRSGIATGQVLIFDLEPGGREISGTPVNIASKIAQDCGEFGKIYVIDSLPAKRTPHVEALRTSFSIKGMEIPVWIA